MSILEKVISATPLWVKRTYLPQRILSYIRERKMSKQYYSQDTMPTDYDCMLFCVDGRYKHGGLCDRMWGLVSTYNLAVKAGKPFRVKWTMPFNITTFLQPNKYDWRIPAESVSESSNEVQVFCISNSNDLVVQERQLDRVLRSTAKQIHVYTPAHAEREHFSANFHTLFKPTPILMEAIDREKKAVGGKYVSISFRFQDALGDFKDDDSPYIPLEQREKLLKESLNVVEKVKKLNPDIEKVLVTADSKTMIDFVKKLPFVYVIPGEIAHMGFTGTDSEISAHLKTFLDFFMISEAEKVYFARHPILYRSTFAGTAAAIGNRPYEEIKFC